MPQSTPPPKPPLRWTGVLFGLALNLLAVSLGYFLAGTLALQGTLVNLPILAAAFLAGGVTAFYVGARGAIHAFLGGFLSAPVLALFILTNNWSYALLAGSICALGGIVAEFFQRRRS